MKFECEIDLDNDAFQPEHGTELARLLRGIGNRVDGTRWTAGTVLDVNGDTVGRWEITGMDE